MRPIPRPIPRRSRADPAPIPPRWPCQVDDYTGTDFAWAWNAPVLQLGSVLLTSGRLFSVWLFGVLVSAFGRSPLAAYMTAAYTSLVVGVIRAMCWEPRQLGTTTADVLAAEDPVPSGEEAVERVAEVAQASA